VEVGDETKYEVHEGDLVRGDGFQATDQIGQDQVRQDGGGNEDRGLRLGQQLGSIL
jgi:hypothetical protein